VHKLKFLLTIHENYRKYQKRIDQIRNKKPENLSCRKSHVYR